MKPYGKTKKFRDGAYKAEVKDHGGKKVDGWWVDQEEPIKSRERHPHKLAAKKMNIVRCENCASMVDITETSVCGECCMPMCIECATADPELNYCDDCYPKVTRTHYDYEKLREDKEKHDDED